jgi:hypothetical protein
VDFVLDVLYRCPAMEPFALAAWSKLMALAVKLSWLEIDVSLLARIQSVMQVPETYFH